MAPLNTPGVSGARELVGSELADLGVPRVVLSLYRGLITIEPSTYLTMHDVAERVAAKHGVTVGDLRGVRRSRQVAWPRHEAFARTVELGRFSLPQIGRFYDRDHTTVLYGLRAHYARQRGEKYVRKCHGGHA